MKRPSILRPLQRWITASILLGFLVALTAAITLPTHAQTTDTLHQVKKIYVDPITGKSDSTAARKLIIDNLQKDHTVQIVDDPTQADAILQVRMETWVRGYVSVNPRSTSGYPAYGGFLSAQLLGKGGDLLWSNIVTPSRYASSGIRHDLADQIAHKLLVALTSSPSKGPVRILKAAGATFPAPLYLAWIESFRQHRPDIQITYNSIGSEAGLEQLHDSKVTFAASDVALSDAYMRQMPVKLLQFATVLGAIVPVYNLPQIGNNLRFTPEILANIYLGNIRSWDDPAIRAVNHGVPLPSAPIVIIHRNDGSGTTFAFTDFLSKTNPDWKATVGSGTTVKWPVGKGVQGNDGVAASVAETPNSIGYTELTYAIQRQLSYGIVRNAAGNFMQANLATLAAAAIAPHGTSAIASSLTNAPGKYAYPITSFTWLLVPESIPDPVTKSAVADFLEWILTAGQKEVSALAYHPLPKETVTRELQMLAAFKAK
ncbi:phosphate ABC transporter phosphate-binding protein [Edaphobacter aggregans]|uniref:Phosphate-binding protein PstS n=1 Tax=Edaphobacter aggregans TaxID=570835 RepID=A0A3R9P7M0_9BACT|nr:phosphate ABC transporter substrate-binding protein PstS [Edaphobacter aggregans]RSL15316.1 phosphate ABC transporter phosphate-binding protein [Edaphobacter aggregans]